MHTFVSYTMGCEKNIFTSQRAIIGDTIVSSSGAVAKLIAKEGNRHIKITFWEVRLISKNCSATVGQVGMLQ
ncbi:50S ribosomal protein L2 plastid [Bienertia sinuspersici]